jgi:catechol 2,3-dioxygenase-like lactoylglutathione lyase family enzyme
MISLWSYPWTFAAEGLGDAWQTLGDIGVDAVNLASHYHSVRAMQPRFPESLFVQYPGGCYFEPDPARFDATPIDPIPNDVPPFEDPLSAVVEYADAHGFGVNGWVVLCHNSRLGQANPAYRLESAFGDPQDHAFCPSHSSVREYFAAVVAATANRGVNEIQLESLGFRSVLHGHGSDFGHDKRQVLTTPTEEILLSQCFCGGCRTAAESHSVAFDDARTLVRNLLRSAFADPQSDLPSLDGLVAEYPTLRDLFDFRAAVIERLTARLADAAGDTALNYYVMDGKGLDAEDVWPAGVRLGELQRHLDRVTALCYVRDPDVARQRVRGIETIVDCPVDVGITFDRETIRSPDELRALVGAVRPSGDRHLHVYHHSLMSDAHLDWLRSVV